MTQGGEKIILAPYEAHPCSRISAKVPELFLPSLWIEEVLWWQNSLKQKKLQWLEMSLSLKYPTGFQMRRWQRGHTPAWSPEDWTWLLGEKSYPAASALAGLPPPKHLLHRSAANRNFSKAMMPQTDVTEAAKSLGGKAGLVYRRAGPNALMERKNGLIKEMGGRQWEGQLWKKETRDSIRKGGPMGNNSFSTFLRRQKITLNVLFHGWNTVGLPGFLRVMAPTDLPAQSRLLVMLFEKSR